MDNTEAKTKILNSFLDRTWFYSWKNKINDPYRSLELIINDNCDQTCKYCYEIKYGKYYFTEESKKPENILKNIKILIQWLKENKFYPTIEIFSSEIFSQEIGFQILEVLFDELDENFESIVIPTNMNFIFDDMKTKRVKELKENFEKKGIYLSLSASIDGAFMEENRPIRCGIQRDEVFYDKLFKFSKENHIAFHPMIYSNRIEYWKDNWLWFQENFKKYDIPFNSIYLLEVRNVEWSVEQVREFGKFLKFLIQWTFEFFGRNKETFSSFILGGGFNILQSIFTTTGRGIPCSIQSTLSVRTGDLMIVPCHRTSYEQFHGGRFTVKDDRIVGIEGINPLLFIQIKSFDNNTQPYCESCYIKYLCSKGCLGAQFETTGDLFTPIPTVCRLEHVRVITILDELNKLGCLGMILERVTKLKRDNVLLAMEEFV